ncbi:hypothetical protein D3C80_1939090 [compost metagenome]
MLQRLGLGFATFTVVRLGEHQLVAQLRGPAVIALGHGLAHFANHGRATADGLDIMLGGFHRRQRVEVGRVAVIEAHVALVHRP